MGTLGLTYLWFIRTGKSSLWKFLSQVLRFPKSLFPSLPISVKCSLCFGSCQCRIRQDFDMHCVTASWNCFQYIFILTKNISSIWIRYTKNHKMNNPKFRKKWNITSTLPHALPWPHLFPPTPEEALSSIFIYISIAFLYCLITYTFIMSIFYLVLV